MTAPIVAMAVSGHGFGHAVRCAEVARALLAHGVRPVVRTDAPAWLFPGQADYLPSPGWPIDVGVAQRGGLELDIDQTRRRWTAFATDFDARADVEAQLLVEHGVNVLIGDIPPLAFAAAARANLPSLALGNFGWDWMYAIWPDFGPIVDLIRRAYQQPGRLLRLPLHSTDADAFCAFGQIEDVPLIARWARRSRCEVRAEIGLDQAARVVLLSFGGFSAQGLDIRGLQEWTNYVFVLTPPLSAAMRVPAGNVVALSATTPDYVSLLSACDVVVTKPGYGIVADCLANRVPILYTDRGPFREYDVLAEALPSLARARYVPRDDLLAGNLGPHLDALLESRAPWTEQRMDGADCVARRVLEFTIEQNG